MRWLLKTGLLFTATLFTSITAGQNIVKRWDNVIQADGRDGEHLRMMKTFDNRLIIACNSGSTSGYDKTMNNFNSGNDVWLLMLDSIGNKIWDRDFWGTNVSRGLSVLDSNTFVLVGEITGTVLGADITAPITPGSKNGPACWLVAFDTLGTILWNKRFAGGTDSLTGSGGGVAWPRELKVANGNIYILGNAMIMPSDTGGDLDITNCAYTNISVPSPYRRLDMLFYKVNPANTLTNEWNKLYGGDSIEWGTAILPLQSGGFLLGGVTTSQVGCNQTVGAYQQPYRDFYLLQTDSNGNINWQHRYGGSKDDWLNGIIDAGNNQYLLYGYTLSPVSYDVSSNGNNDTSLWMIKIDNMGNKLWDTRHGSCTDFNFSGLALANPNTDPSGIMNNSVDGIKTSDGGFLFVSNVDNNLPCGDVSEPGKGLEDYWMLKLDSAGNKQWDKRFGGPGYDIAQRVVEMRPGYYIIGGFSFGITNPQQAPGGDKSEPTIGSWDIWLVGVEDSEAIIGMHEMMEKSLEFNIYPNPARDEVTLSLTPTLFKGEGALKLGIYIYDITGKQQLHQTISASSPHHSITSSPINISTLKNGIYIVEVRDKSGNQSRKKLVKL